MNKPMLSAALAAGKAPAPHVSDWSKAGAILIGVAVLILLYIVTALITHHWNPKELVNGFDGFGSTSKLQWFLWLLVILFGYAAIWTLRAEQDHYNALSDIPVNLLTVLGFSTGTAAAAKGITSGYVQAGKMTKSGALGNEPAKNTGGIFQDDGGTPELAKIQMIGFTIVAIGIFLATVIHQILSDDITASLPNIDSSLLVLMGISQGGYLSKKLVTFGTAALYPPNPGTGLPGTSVTLRGANLGPQAGNQLLFGNTVLDTTAWTATSVQFTVPVNDPATGALWAGLPTTVPVVVSVTGQPSNSVNFTIVKPVLNSLSPQAGPRGIPVTLTGTNLGPQPGSQLSFGNTVLDTTAWTATSVQFTVPVNDPATGALWAGLPTTVPVVVSAASQASNSVNFTVTPPPGG